MYATFVISLTFLLVIPKHQCLITTFEQRRTDKENLEKALYNFTGNRKKTHFSLPSSIINPSKHDVHVNSDDNVNVTYKRQRLIETEKITSEDENEFNISKNTGKKTNGVNIQRNKFNPLKHTSGKELIWRTFINNQYNIIKKLNKFFEKQNMLRQKTTEDEFKELMAITSPGINKYTVMQATLSLDQISRKKVHYIDETKVREALKADPLVQRILKIGRKKRVDYLKRVNKD